MAPLAPYRGPAAVDPDVVFEARVQHFNKENRLNATLGVLLGASGAATVLALPFSPWIAGAAFATFVGGAAAAARRRRVTVLRITALGDMHHLRVENTDVALRFPLALDGCSAVLDGHFRMVLLVKDVSGRTIALGADVPERDGPRHNDWFDGARPTNDGPEVSFVLEDVKTMFDLREQIVRLSAANAPS